MRAVLPPPTAGHERFLAGRRARAAEPAPGEAAPVERRFTCDGGDDGG